MPKMTKADWLAAVEACGDDMSQDSLIQLVYKDAPNALWTDVIREMHVMQNGIYNYLASLFPTRVWNDWQGITELGKMYHPAYIPFDLSVFQRTMEICDPSNLNECHTDYCQIPEGGVSNIPELEMYKAGFKTRRMCIANIRTSSQAKQIAEYLIRERFQVDEQLMNMFYTMAAIRMTGHKWVLEYETQGGNIIPVANTSPYNVMQGFRYNYMEPLFPRAQNMQNIMPLDLSVLDILGRGLTLSRNPNYQATGPRGEPVFELWHGEDWWRQEMLDNPEYIERMKYTMPTSLLPGYTLGNGPTEKEIIGNFSLRQMPNLPRFAESTRGGMTIVQPLTPVPVDSGNRALHNYREYDNAPYILTMVIGKNAGEILSRPAIATGIEGKAILPITGNADWVYRNDYDKECNPDLNMPYFQKRFEMGFRMLNPDAGWGIISRSKAFRLRPLNTCALKPIIKVDPGRLGNCDFLTVGCQDPNNKIVDNDWMQQVDERKILCTAQSCGSNLIYRLTIEPKNIDKVTPNQSPLGLCACGDTVQLSVADNEGNPTGYIEGTVIEYMRPNSTYPFVNVLVSIGSPLSAGTCIQGIACKAETGNSYSIVVNCVDANDDDDLSANQVKFLLDSPLRCNVGAGVTITYLDDEEDVIGSTVAGTIVSFDPDTLAYVIHSSVGGGFVCQMRDGQSEIRIACS